MSLHNQIVVLNQRIEVLQKALAETGKEINLPAMPADYQNVVWTATTPGSGNSGGSGSVNQPAPPAAETKQTAMVTPASGANVRYGPGQDFTAIAVAACGDKVTVLDSAAGPGGEKWCKIRLADGREGYIRADLLYY